MNVLTNKAMNEMRKKSRNTSKALIQESKEPKKKAKKKPKQEINYTVPRIVHAAFWVMIAFLSFRTLF